MFLAIFFIIMLQFLMTAAIVHHLQKMDQRIGALIVSLRNELQRIERRLDSLTNRLDPAQPPQAPQMPTIEEFIEAMGKASDDYIKLAPAAFRPGKK